MKAEEITIGLQQKIIDKQAEQIQDLNKLLVACVTGLKNHITDICRWETCAAYDHCSRDFIAGMGEDYCLLNIIGYCLTWDPMYNHDCGRLKRMLDYILSEQKKIGHDFFVWDDVNVKQLCERALKKIPEP